MKPKSKIQAPKIALLAMGLFVLLTSCRKSGRIDADPYAAFKADATPRWESGTAVEKNELSPRVFVTDMGGDLFSSPKYKTGRISADGNSYEIIEFSGTPAVGKPAEPGFRTPNGIVVPHRLEIVKVLSDKLWIVFQETATSTERRVVQ